MSSWNATIEEQSKNSFYFSLSLYDVVLCEGFMVFIYRYILHSESQWCVMFYDLRRTNTPYDLVEWDRHHLLCLSISKKRNEKEHENTQTHTNHIIQGRIVVSCIKYMSLCLSLSRTHTRTLFSGCLEKCYTLLSLSTMLASFIGNHSLFMYPVPLLSLLFLSGCS